MGVVFSRSEKETYLIYGILQTFNIFKSDRLVLRR